jgi:hypothetical protein
VERSFFGTQAGGVALVTRLERINDDGTSARGTERWSANEWQIRSNRDLVDYLLGLFFVPSGHYRVIVFILQDLPFSQSPQTIGEGEARAWLSNGFNFLPLAIANHPFAPGGHCTVLVYEFASDGKAVHEITSGLTGKQHLEKAGVLSLSGTFPPPAEATPVQTLRILYVKERKDFAEKLQSYLSSEGYLASTLYDDFSQAERREKSGTIRIVYKSTVKDVEPRLAQAIRDKFPADIGRLVESLNNSAASDLQIQLW